MGSQKRYKNRWGGSQLGESGEVDRKGRANLQTKKREIPVGSQKGRYRRGAMRDQIQKREIPMGSQKERYRRGAMRDHIQKREIPVGSSKRNDTGGEP